MPWSAWYILKSAFEFFRLRGLVLRRIVFLFGMIAPRSRPVCSPYQRERRSNRTTAVVCESDANERSWNEEIEEKRCVEGRHYRGSRQVQKIGFIGVRLAGCELRSDRDGGRSTGLHCIKEKVRKLIDLYETGFCRSHETCDGLLTVEENRD